MGEKSKVEYFQIARHFRISRKTIIHLQSVIRKLNYSFRMRTEGVHVVGERGVWKKVYSTTEYPDYAELCNAPQKYLQKRFPIKKYVQPHNTVSTIKCLWLLHIIVIYMEYPLQELSSETGISLERSRQHNNMIQAAN